MELLPHRCHLSIYGLAIICELDLNAVLGIKHIFSIIMEMLYHHHCIGKIVAGEDFYGFLAEQFQTVK